MANEFSDYAGDLTGSLTGTIDPIISVLIKIISGVLGLTLIIGIMVWNKKRKMYNVPITIWIPRSDGKITDEISAKGGYFRTKQRSGGTITSFRLKRKGLSSVDIPPPGSKFLVGLSRKLYLIQKGVDDFEPVLPDSFRYVETQKGNKIPVVNLKCINQDATAWVEDNRENAKKRFTIQGFWEKYKDFIQITIFIFIVMLSLYINWVGLQEVVEGLQKVANTLTGVGQGGVSVS